MTPPDESTPPPFHPLRVKTRNFATFRAIFALILREMSTRYGKSPGGYVWAVLEPLGAILVLAFGFSLLTNFPALGTSFILFYATGYLPFSLYQNVLNMVSRALAFSRPLLHYPAVTWMDALIARAILNTLTGVMVSYILISGILAFSDTQAVLQIGPIILAILMSALLGVSIGCMNCFLIGVFPPWEVIWSIVSRPLFLASGILILYEDLPATAQTVLWFNPLLHITGAMRSGFYPMYEPEYVNPTFVIVLSLVLLATSLVLLRRYHRDILSDS